MKTALITGLFVVLPAWLAILLFVKILVKLGVVVKPITGQLPKEIGHPTMVALVVFILICLLVGALFHTPIGRKVGRIIQSNILDRIPGYASLQAIAAQTAGFESDQEFQPALIVVEDGSLQPAFLVETHEEDLSTVFIPSVPTPMAGGIFIMPSDRVHEVDIPVPTMMKCISKWGSGSSELLDALKAKGTKLPIPW
ncbi:DUF502 domain-containing protein [Haloferula sp.]|uniref:DUF502 domain-containing protein n=1 Tax=Haloferula sp. TaxID=2497595 RepID=UPI00329C4AB8